MILVLQVAEEVSVQLATVKSMLCGSGDSEPQSEVTAQLAQEIYNASLLEQLIIELPKIDFEVSLSLPSCLHSLSILIFVSADMLDQQ